MNKRMTVLAAAAAVVLAIPVVVLASGPCGGPHPAGEGGRLVDGAHNPGAMLLRLADRLDLSAEQRAAIEAILKDEGPTIRDFREQLTTARRDFRDTMSAGTFDEAAVRAHAEAQSKPMTEMMVASARMRAHLFAVLSAEQVQQLEEIRGLFEDFSGPRRGRFRR